ncbi:MAG: 16S rRNA (adenine(1518)-N(6)/adenine(1519)-N(6))-dimethyltransferase RsmA [candidate division WOR-3 bacterium]|nr:16S rRNA (adenine(1518)-N(6)/adenine(1519)-N(6))-dimethyltransferase RsmA [candidate division WOR-3 bacterium]
MFKPKKALGQSFLISPRIADRLVSALELDNTDKVLEIGAGKGILTKRIAEKAHKVFAVEIDKRLIPILQNNTREFSNVEIINADILHIDWQALDKVKIIGNIPYHLSSSILFKLLDNINLWDITVLTLQREFADRLLAKPGTKEYGALSVIFEPLTIRKKLITIPSSAFRPRPKVVSTAIIIRKRIPALFTDISSKVFNKIVHIAFRHRRKNIANNLNLGLSLDKIKISQISEKTGIDLTQRAENLTIQEFYQLAKTIFSQGIMENIVEHSFSISGNTNLFRKNSEKRIEERKKG